MVERYKFRGLLVYGAKGSGPAAVSSLQYVKSKQPKTTKDIAAALATLLDVDLSSDKLEILAKVADRRGGMKVLDRPDLWAGTLDRSLLMLMAAPEMHVC